MRRKPIKFTTRPPAISDEDEIAPIRADGVRCCAYCGVPIPPDYAHQVFCSESCRHLRWKRRYPASYQRRIRAALRHKARKARREKRTLIATMPPRVKSKTSRQRAEADPTALAVAAASGVPAPLSRSALSSPDSLIPPSSKELRQFIRGKYGDEAQQIVEKLHEVVFTLPGVPWKVRVECLRELLDRGWGKSAQAIAVAAVAPIFTVPDEQAVGTLLPDLGNADPEVGTDDPEVGTASVLEPSLI